MITFILITVSALQAQKLFDLGIKGGVSRDNIRLDNVADNTAIMGWHFGGFMRVKPPVAPGIQVEALYNSMGTDVRALDAQRESSELRLQYLQAPLFLVFSLGPAELHLGGYASHLMNASINQPAEVQQEIFELREDRIRDTDYGLLGGLGLKLGSFYMGARYTFGLGTVGEPENVILHDARNMQAQFYIGIGLNK